MLLINNGYDSAFSNISFNPTQVQMYSYLDGLSLPHPGCNMEGCVVVVQLSHRAQLDAFFMIQKDLKMEMESS